MLYCASSAYVKLNQQVFCSSTFCTLKMDSEPYKEWINLYDKSFESAWYIQQPKLRNAAMILKVLDNEFKRIYKEAEGKFKLLEKDINTNENVPRNEKENIDDNEAYDNPRVFPNIMSPAANDTNNINGTTIIAKENIRTSPKLNRAYKLSKLRKLKQGSGLNYSALNIKQSAKNKLPNAADIIDSTIIDKTPDTPAICKRSRTKGKSNKGKLNTKPIDGTLTQVFFDLSNNTKDLDRPEIREPDKILPERDNETIETNHNAVIFKEPVVRGKARQNLQGWDCRECREFYEELNLNTQESKKLLNKCSKHRSNFEQHDFTPKGFWDLNFPPTPPVRHLSDSTYFQY
ncbi:hypothetical protein Trydic_g17610 [Trypoxylus dichotomus]